MTLFIVAFPLGPLFSFINNILEMRVDSYNIVHKQKRPIGHQANGIGTISGLLKKYGDVGVWEEIMKWISYFAVVVNACMIAFASKNFNDTYLQGLSEPAKLVARLSFILLFEVSSFDFGG